MTTIMTTILALAIGIYVGSIVFGKESTQTPQVLSKHTPMVISMVFRQPLTKGILLEEVLKPSELKFLRHFAPDVNLNDVLNLNFLEKRADEIMRWYNPEYNELLIVAHPTGKLQEEGNQTFTVDFLWKKPN